MSKTKPTQRPPQPAETDLPEGWALATIGDITVPKVAQSGPGDGQEFTYIDIASVDNERKNIIAPRVVPTQEAPSRARQVVRSGDVLVSMTRPNLNAVALVGPELDGAIASTGFDVLRSIEWLPGWLFLVVCGEAFIESMTALVQGALYPAVRPRDVRGFEFPLPPLAEQKRIVAKVEELLARVNAARARLARLPAILKRFRQSVLATACSGQLTAEWRRSQGSAIDLEDLPEGWRTSTVAGLASREPRSIQSGPFGSNLLHSEFQTTGILAIGIDNVLHGAFSLGREHRISPAKFRELTKYQARPGDVLITVMATIGRVCVVPEDIEPAIITKHVYRITPDRTKVEPPYLMFSLMGDPALTAEMAEQVHGQTRPGINGVILKGLPVRVPPLEEQREIVRRVEALFALADGIEAHVRAATVRAERLPQAILARAFRGELVPTEADLAAKDGRDYEPAERLLARIREEAAQRAPQRKIRSRTATGKKAPMKKIDKASVLEAIEGMPSESFAFDELRAKVPGDYDRLKEILFALLDDPQSGIVQVFDKQAKAMRFRRRAKA